MSAGIATKLKFGECDCCQKPNRVLHHCWAHGMETAACAECQGNPLSDDIDDLRDEIDRLRPVAKTIEEYAHLIALQGAIIEATGGGVCAKLRGLRELLVAAGDADALDRVGERR